MEANSTLVIFAIIAALGLVTVVAVDIILTAQEAEAKGCSARHRIQRKQRKMPQTMNSSIIMVFALVAALGLVSVVAVDIMLTMQEVEAQKPRGCNRSVAANASQGRCVEPGK